MTNYENDVNTKKKNRNKKHFCETDNRYSYFHTLVIAGDTSLFPRLRGVRLSGFASAVSKHFLQLKQVLLLIWVNCANILNSLGCLSKTTVKRFG